MLTMSTYCVLGALPRDNMLMDQEVDPFGGVPQIGLIEYDFDPDGVSWRTRSPAGVAEFSLSDISRRHRAVRFSPEAPW